MRILYISQYFPPEVGATQTRAIEMARAWQEEGHQVTVLTEVPNHPRGIIPPEYRGRWFAREKYEGLDVMRVWVYARPEKNFRTRMGLYLSFLVMAVLAAIHLRGRYDLVYATSPPFFVGMAGVVLSWVKGGKFVFEVRDIWPQVAVELGELRNPRFIRWAESLERWYYRKARRVVVVTKGFYDVLRARGIRKEKLLVIPNGTNPQVLKDRGRSKREALELDAKFVVMYAGLMGVAQGMEHLCDVMERLKQHPNVHFLFVGEGPLKSWLIGEREQRSLTNLTVLEEVPRDEVSEYISAADVCLVPLKRLPIFRDTQPSKMFDFLACARPVILSVDGVARAVLEESGGGVFVEPEDVEDMTQAILRLRDQPDLAREMGRRGRAFVSAHYSRPKLARRLLGELVQMIEGNPGG